MACFTAPLVEAVVTTVATKVIEKKEMKVEGAVVGVSTAGTEKPCFSKKLKVLSKLLYGGSALLAFEHLWHGEIQPFFPFLTAAENPESFAEMLREVSTVGVSMAVVVTLAWVAIIAVQAQVEKTADKAAAELN